MRLAPHESVLVTGGSGFIGSALVRRLLGLGCRVRVVSRSVSRAAPGRIEKGDGREGRLEWFEGDISRPHSIDAAFDGAKYVFHLAALVNSPTTYAHFERANVRGTENVCEMSLRHRVAKLIHVSTCDVFGLPTSDEVITEQTPYREWKAPYPDSKIRAAEVVKAFRAKGLVSSMIYPGWVYGPGDRAFLPALLRQLKSGFMPLWAPSGFELHLVFIEDLIDALLEAAGRAAADNEDFLILDHASGVELNDLCRRAASFFELDYRSFRVPYGAVYLAAWLSQRLARIGLVKRPLLTTTDVKSFGYRFRFSTAKARDVLGWTARTPFSVGIQAALEWQAANPALLK